MRINHANSRWNAPRLLALSAVLLGSLVLVLMASSGGAAAAPGLTDLSITKTDSPDPVVQGNNLTYTIRVNNTGSGDATNVLVTDTLPASSDLDFGSATSTAGTCQRNGNTVTCNLGTVLAGTNQTVTIVVKAKKAGTLSNTASVASPQDTNSANNSATAATTVAKKGSTTRPRPRASMTSIVSTGPPPKPP